MVQHERPSGNDHVRFGMVSSSLLRRHGHRLDHHGRDTQNCGRNLRSTRVLLFGLSRQNILVRSRIDPDTSHTDREATAAPRFAQYVWTVSNIQTPGLTSLSDLQPLHLQDGPSLSLDEQLRRSQ